MDHNRTPFSADVLELSVLSTTLVSFESVALSLSELTLICTSAAESSSVFGIVGCCCCCCEDDGGDDDDDDEI